MFKAFVRTGLRLGAFLGSVLFAALPGASAPGVPATKSPAESVEQWGTFEVVFRGPEEGNPFVEVEFAATFESGGAPIEVPGFYDGNGLYRARMMPERPGAWTYRTRSNRPELDGKTGKFTVTAAKGGNHGPVKVRDLHFVYADGTPYLMDPAEQRRGDSQGNKTMADWDRFFALLQREDPHQRLRSIHNIRSFYDHSKPWVTHLSVQRNGDLRPVLDWRNRYGKPVIVDECGYEGNISNGWGKLSGKELVRRFWVGTLSGGYVGHGETMQHPQEILWWSKGGELHGQSPPRLAFLRRQMESLPFMEMNPSRAGTNVLVLAKPGSVYLAYALQSGPIELLLEGDQPYTVEVLDTWNMAAELIDRANPGTFRIDAPRGDYLVRLKAAGTGPHDEKVTPKKAKDSPTPETPETSKTKQQPLSWGNWPKWGDQGDGGYLNPVLPSDYSDIDCIRVGSDYYAISSTFQFSPGMVVLHSKDLVNWGTLGHVVQDVTQISPEMNWDRMKRYGRGVWAGAIRFHRGKFWVYFGTPDEGYFVSTAENPAGPWSPVHQMTKAAGWDDCCPFWDDDGQGYFVGTHFADGYKTYLYKLTDDGHDLIPESKVLINQGGRREANKLYKVSGWYYHFFSEHKGSAGRYIMMQRAKKIAGPYTEVRQLTHGNREANEPNQGGLVQTVAGEWYFFTHHGTGSWEGRAASLLPVTWREGWPVPGEVGPDGLGRMAWGGQKPVRGMPVVVPQTSDEFSSAVLPPQWEWNHQPRPGKWSLSARPGWLRLHAFNPLRPDDLTTAGNTLTQRSFRTTTNRVTVKLELSAMADGQKAGLCHFSRSHSALGVHQSGGTRYLEFRVNGATTAGPEITGDHIWLSSWWELEGLSRFSYSLDGISFTEFGQPYQFDWGHYRGNRIGIYSFNNVAEAGYVDVDWFHHSFAAPGDNQ